MSMTMTADARERFLAEPRIAIFAVVRPERAPLAVPVWYAYAPGGDVEVFIDRGSVKERLLRETGRFSLSVHTEDTPYRYVTVEGPASWDESPTVEKFRSLVARYLEPDDTERYVSFGFGEQTLLIRMRPEHWLSNDQTEAWAQLRGTAGASLS